MFAYSKFHKVKWLRRERGTILILVLLIVAMVAGLSIKFTGEFQLGLARAETRWFGAQIRAYFLSGETVACNILQHDAPDSDDRKEDWFQQSGLTYPVDAGDITVSFDDASAQIDLNALLANQLDPNKPLTDPLRYDQSQRMFIRLLQEFPESVHSPDEAAAILQSVVYWAKPVDQYQVGDDDQYYMNLPQPYRASHAGSYRSLEELQLVRGLTPVLMAQLRPFLTVMSGSLRMNINTLPVQLLRAINVKSDLRPLDEVSAQTMFDDLTSKPIKQPAELDAFMQSQFGQGNDVDRDFDNKTLFFWLNMTVHMGELARSQKSLLARGAANTPFTVVRREESF